MSLIKKRHETDGQKLGKKAGLKPANIDRNFNIFSSLHKEFIWVMLFWLQQYQQLYYQLACGFVAVGMTRRKTIAKHPVRHIGKQLRHQ